MPSAGIKLLPEPRHLNSPCAVRARAGLRSVHVTLKYQPGENHENPLHSATTVNGLHAQAKTPLYLVSEIDVTNPEAYGKEYAPKSQALIKAAGGRFVA